MRCVQVRLLRLLRRGCRLLRLSLLFSLLRFLDWVALRFRLRLFHFLLCPRLLHFLLRLPSNLTMLLLGPVRRSSAERQSHHPHSGPALAVTLSLPAPAVSELAAELEKAARVAASRASATAVAGAAEKEKAAVSTVVVAAVGVPRVVVLQAPALPPRAG